MRDPGRRDRILDVARRHFARFGYRRTSLDLVAAEAGCAKGALYLEFEGKRQLFQAVVNRSRTEIRARWAREVVAKPTALERIRAALRFSYHLSASEPLFDTWLVEPEHSIPLPEERATVDANVSAINQWVEEGIRQGEIREGVDPHAARALFAMLHFASRTLERARDLGLVAADEPRLDAQVRSHQRLDAIIDAFLAGIAAPKRRRTS